MAQIVTTVTPIATVFPYSHDGMPDVDRTNLPKGEIRFNSVQEEIPLTTGGDTQEFLINCILPNNFSYALVDLVASLNAPVAADWDLNWEGSICNSLASPGRMCFDFSVGAPGFGSSRGGYRKAFFKADAIPNSLWYVPQGNGGETTVQVRGICPTVDMGDAYIGFNIRLLQYNVSQAHNVAVNVPMLTR